MPKNKISIIGAGNVGATAALRIAELNLGDIVLFDVVEGRPQGVALDISQCTALAGFQGTVTGTNRDEDMAGSDLVIITAGLPRKPGMTREELLGINADIVGPAAKRVAEHSPDAILIIVTNPLDAMCYAAWKRSGLPKERVIGMAGVLDTSRFRLFVGRELGMAPEKIEAMVLGSHGDEMVPVISSATADGKRLTELMDSEKLQSVIEHTQKGGAEIVNLLKTGSAYYAPGFSIAEMADAILNDRKKTLPCSCLLQGEYEQHEVFMGVPALLSRKGIEKIEEITMSDEEKTALGAAAEKIKTLQVGIGT